MLANVLQRVSGALFNKVDNILRETDFDPASLKMKDRDKLASILADSSQEAFIAFVQDKVKTAANMTSQLVHYSPDIPSDQVLNSQMEFSVSSFIIDIAKLCADSSLLTSIVFCEQLPVLKSLHQPEMIRRAGRSSVAGGNMNFHLDIERLFSAKVKIFDYSKMTYTTDYFTTAYMKAVLKCCQESIRLMSISQVQSLQLAVDMAFMKLVSSTLVKESSSQIDVLVDQVLLAANRRCFVPTSQGEKFETETQVVNKATTEGILTLGQMNAIFAQRS